jgi:hypothetical protein
MSGRLADLRSQLTATRARLEALGDRVAAVRVRLAAGGEVQVDAGAGRTPPPEARVTLFPGLGTGGEDVELTFEVLDTEDPGRGR